MVSKMNSYKDNVCGAEGEKTGVQRILVFQQDGSGETKLKGIQRYGRGMFDLNTVSVDGPLPLVIDDSEEYLPSEIHADMVIDFLKHPDISHDLAALCQNKNIPVVASGKKIRGKGVFTPPV